MEVHRKHPSASSNRSEASTKKKANQLKHELDQKGIHDNHILALISDLESKAEECAEYAEKNLGRADGRQQEQHKYSSFHGGEHDDGKKEGATVPSSTHPQEEKESSKSTIPRKHDGPVTCCSKADIHTRWGSQECLRTTISRLLSCLGFDTSSISAHGQEGRNPKLSQRVAKILEANPEKWKTVRYLLVDLAILCTGLPELTHKHASMYAQKGETHSPNAQSRQTLLQRAAHQLEQTMEQNAKGIDRGSLEKCLRHIKNNIILPPYVHRILYNFCVACKITHKERSNSGALASIYKMLCEDDQLRETVHCVYLMKNFVCRSNQSEMPGIDQQAKDELNNTFQRQICRLLQQQEGGHNGNTQQVHRGNVESVMQRMHEYLCTLLERHGKKWSDVQKTTVSSASSASSATGGKSKKSNKSKKKSSNDRKNKSNNKKKGKRNDDEDDDDDDEEESDSDDDDDETTSTSTSANPNQNATMIPSDADRLALLGNKGKKNNEEDIKPSGDAIPDGDNVIGGIQNMRQAIEGFRQKMHQGSNVSGGSTQSVGFNVLDNQKSSGTLEHSGGNSIQLPSGYE
jgi:hypothetical protein